MSPIKTLHHLAVICSDYSRSKEFYTSVLGLQILREVYREDRESYKLDLALNGTYIIELFSFPNPPPRHSRPEAAGLRHLAFGVERIEESLTYFRSKGVTVESIRVDEHTGKKFSFLFDPDNLPIEVYEIGPHVINS